MGLLIYEGVHRVPKVILEEGIRAALGGGVEFVAAKQGRRT